MAEYFKNPWDDPQHYNNFGTSSDYANAWSAENWEKTFSGLINNSIDSNNDSSSKPTTRKVEIKITSKIIGEYEARSYPDDDINDNGKKELYKVPVYQIIVSGKDGAGNPFTKDFQATRFMPYYNNPNNPHKEYKTKGWVNCGLSNGKTIIVSRYLEDYSIHNTYSPARGAIVLEGTFYIHAGPTDISNVGWGSAGCVEVFGDWGAFKETLQSISGSNAQSSDEAIKELIKQKHLKIIIEKAELPDIQNNFSREL